MTAVTDRTALRRDEHWGIDRIDTTLLKGVGILMIMLHNFLHLLRSTPGENEFTFRLERFQLFFDGFQSSPDSIPRLLATFLGHFGVQLFVFLSAYGLTKSYGKSRPAYRQFLYARFDRIYPAFALAICAWAIVTGAELGLLGPLKVLYWNWGVLAFKLTLVSNLVPGQALAPVGPWWFVPFIFQLYFLFPGLFRLHERQGDRALWAIAAGAVVLTMALDATVPPGILILSTPLGHLSEFCLGMWAARRNSSVIPGQVVLLAAVGFILGNLEGHLWYLSHFCALVLMIAAWNGIRRVVRNQRWASVSLSFLGGLSLQLFLVNGFLREPLVGWAIDSGSEGFALVLVAIFLAASIVVAGVLQWTEVGLRRLVARNSGPSVEAGRSR